jgi:hypothetical protein
MDALHRSVSAAVEQAIRAGASVADTFYRVVKLAHEAQGKQFTPTALAAPLPGHRPPHLTEPWFC